MSVILYGPSLVVSQVTGLNVWIAVSLCGLVCTVYTSLVCKRKQEEMKKSKFDF